MKCEACRACYLFFENSLINIIITNNTGAHMLDYIYHMPLNLLKYRIYA